MVTGPAELAQLARAAVFAPERAADLAAWRAAHGLGSDAGATGGADTATAAALPPPVAVDPKRAAKLEKFFVGAAMRESGGRAAPALLTAAVAKALEGALV